MVYKDATAQNCFQHSIRWGAAGRDCLKLVLAHFSMQELLHGLLISRVRLPITCFVLSEGRSAGCDCPSTFQQLLWV